MTEKESKVIEIELQKESGMEIVTETAIHPPEILQEATAPEISVPNPEIDAPHPPALGVETALSLITEPVHDYYSLTRQETEVNDITTAHLWKRKDETALAPGEKITVKLKLLNEITDYLKVNEPKKMTDRVSVRRQRRTLPNDFSKQKVMEKKRIEKKPRKDCVCMLDRVDDNKRKNLLILIRHLMEADEKKVEEIVQFAQQFIPEMMEEDQLQDENIQNQDDVMV